MYTFVATSKQLLTFLKQSARYEKQVSFIPPKGHRNTVTCYTLRCVLIVAYIGNVWIGTFMAIGFLHTYEFTNTINLLFKIAFVLGNILFYAYDMVHFIVLRPCAEVILLYIQHQSKLLPSIVGKASGARSKQLERVRTNLWVIRGLKDSLNNTWRHAIMSSITLAVGVACITIYTAFDKDVPTLERLMATIYATSLAVDILDVAALSQALGDEVVNLFIPYATSAHCWYL
ncbi:hypothetical protein HPB48_017075 [Haemaphysalis longicornis]|uniref:Uncharacterized protein n=1 Tax=Haemaphysalis longicornis TaxID=44386 RepID=A0A9J6GF49_HAELO|nr:hypothetical protein HPB48_017075 [Haemaphysalis longicornis]